MQNLLRLLVLGQRIDRHALYLMLALVIALPFLVTVPVPKANIAPYTKQFFDTVEAMAADPARKEKLVIVCTNYGAGTFAENQTQTEAVLRHLMRLRLKFALFSFNTPQGRDLGQGVADKLQARYNYVYGRDYVNFGFRPIDAVEPLLKAAVRDIPESFGNDFQGTPLTQVPVMAGVKTVNDVGLIVEIASSNTLPLWLQFFQRTGDQPVATLYCPTSVMGPEAFPLLKSGQLQGMILGLAGATEYEQILGEASFGTRASASLSYAHLLIILLILLGNAGMFAERYLARKAEAR